MGALWSFSRVLSSRFLRAVQLRFPPGRRSPTWQDARERLLWPTPIYWSMWRGACAAEHSLRGTDNGYTVYCVIYTRFGCTVHTHFLRSLHVFRMVFVESCALDCRAFVREMKLYPPGLVMRINFRIRIAFAKFFKVIASIDRFFTFSYSHRKFAFSHFCIAVLWLFTLASCNSEQFDWTQFSFFSYNEK